MNKTIICKYNSVGEMSAKLNAANVQQYFIYKQDSHTGSERFTGSKDYTEADNLLLYGDKELQKKIEAAGVLKTRAKLTGKGTRREIYSSVAGFAAHVPNYITGVPTSMLNVRQRQTKTPVIDLYYNMAAGGGNTAEEIIEASAKVISAAMTLEAQGIRLNIYTVILSKEKNDTVVLGCKIKSSGQAFDTLKMAYPMAHPSMIRRHFFREIETRQGVNKYFKTGYGHPVIGDDAVTTLKNAGITNANARVISYTDAKQMTIDEIVKSIAG